MSHRDEEARAKHRFDVPVGLVDARMDEQRKQSDDAGTRRVYTLRERNGRNRSVSLVRENVAEVRSDDRHTTESRRWIGLAMNIGAFRYHFISHYLRATQSGESERTETTLGARNRAAVEVETKRRRCDLGRRCQLSRGPR